VSIAITNIEWCVAYQRRVRAGGVPCAVVVQYYCNIVGITWRGGGGNDMMIGSFTKALR